ncbi:hypothetical protein TNCV_370471 [Trichonephila clavipes]|nr:hypothetical protein TNCV_370471 [Trichonephila clavipes]
MEVGRGGELGVIASDSHDKGVSPERHCCKTSAANKGCWVYSLDPHLKRCVLLLSVDRHTPMDPNLLYPGKDLWRPCYRGYATFIKERLYVIN